MPDSHGYLTPGEKSLVTSWLNSKWTNNNRCPISGDNSWRVGDFIVHTAAYSGVMMSGPTYPHVAVICSSCGYTIFFNAVMMGITEARNEPTRPNIG